MDQWDTAGYQIDLILSDAGTGAAGAVPVSPDSGSGTNGIINFWVPLYGI